MLAFPGEAPFAGRHFFRRIIFLESRVLPARGGSVPLRLHFLGGVMPGGVGMIRKIDGYGRI
ncbi:hypothetical protein [Thauera sp. SDU_THAU2]|uniref:hypothetical protein n=1 Tax=Thauera sp. SDU_THAU2 TaxID=3136633 RepID=UPI00311F9227